MLAGHLYIICSSPFPICNWVIDGGVLWLKDEHLEQSLKREKSPGRKGDSPGRKETGFCQIMSALRKVNRVGCAHQMNNGCGQVLPTKIL